MAKTICGYDTEIVCKSCPSQGQCAGCIPSDGHPFGEPCLMAELCRNGDDCLEKCKSALLNAINALSIADMDEVTELYALKGSFINMEYQLPSGQAARFWNDNKIYFGTQMPKQGTDRCYGIAADDRHLLVCEYGADGTDAEIVVFLRWNNAERTEI